MSALQALQQYITKEDFLKINGLKFDVASYQNKKEKEILKAFLTQEKDADLKSDLEIIFIYL